MKTMDAITITAGNAEMAYNARNGAPWHKLGTGVDGLMTSADAMAAAHMDWDVEKTPIRYVYGGETRQVPGKFATIRSDNGAALGVVGSDYHILQNREAFGFMDSLVSEGAAMYETVGSLQGGKTVWVMVKLPSGFEVVSGDKVEDYLLLRNTHDGSSRLSIQFTEVRVVCWNTLQAALKENATRFSARHTLNIASKVADARAVLGIAREYQTAFAAQCEKLAAKSIDRKRAASLAGRILEIPQDDVIELAKNGGGKSGLEKAFVNVLTLWESGTGQDIPGVAGTTWALYNAVTEYIDHTSPLKATQMEREAEARFERTTVYQAALRQRAWDVLTTAAAPKFG
jgi:phage/plasmid-like protein (TIGR03299 family)